MKNAWTLNIVGLLIALVFIVVLRYSSNTTEAITDRAEYEQYLDKTRLSKAEMAVAMQATIKFWQAKLENKPESGLYKMQLAACLANRFKASGEITDIVESDALLQSALQGDLLKTAGIYHMLSTNAITQHQFNKALEYADAALATGESPKASNLLRYDALMELGREDEAREILMTFNDEHSFDIIIRRAKMQDSDGNLGGAISSIENALQWCEAAGNKQLESWALNTLGDMYGHAGRVEDAYQAYLDVLAINPADHYALKGIAWIAYSHDKQAEEALGILNFLKENHAHADYDRLIADIESFRGDAEKEEAHLVQFAQAVSDGRYGCMYDKYLAELNLETLNDAEKSLQYINKEIENRPNAQSYDLLAWYHYKTGNTDKALDIAQQYVEGNTYEPDVLYHLGMIYKADGNLEKAKAYLEEAAEAEFELGPAIAQNIKNEVNDLMKM